MRPIFGCPPFGGRTTVFNNNYYSMPPMMGCNCQSNFFNKIPAMIMMSAFMQNMLRPMTQCNYYPQQSYYPGLYLSGGGTEGAGGASSSSSEQNLKNLQDFYGDCRFTQITEDGVTKYYCSNDEYVYTDTSLIDLQKQLELAGIKPKQKKEKSSSTDEVSLTRRESADEADEADGAGSAGDAGDAGGAGGAGHRTFKRADLSSITKPGGYTWIKYEELSDAQKDKLKNCKTITELMKALNSPEFGTTNLKVGYNEFHNWYKDANPSAIDGENIVDITKLDLIVREDYKIGSDNLVLSKGKEFAYSVNESGITYYKRGNGGYLEKCKLDDKLKSDYPTMIQNANNKLNKLKKDAPSESKIAQYRYITGSSNSQRLDYNGGNMVYKKNGTNDVDDDAIFKIDGNKYTIQSSHGPKKLDFCEITDMRSLGCDFKLIDPSTGHFNQDRDFWIQGNSFKKFILKGDGPLGDWTITWDDSQKKVVLQKDNKSYIMDNIMVGYEKIT